MSGRADLESHKMELYNAEVVNDIYRNPVVIFLRSLIDNIPVIKFADVECEQLVREHCRKKYEELLQCIIEDGTITIDDVRDVNVIMEFTKLIQVTEKLVQNDKIKYLGNLFKASVNDIKARNFDEFEENLQLIDMLSLRELELTELLFKCESEFMDSNGSYSLEESWKFFVEECRKQYGFNESDISSRCMAISRSGLCMMEWIPTFGAVSMFRAYTSPSYHRLREYIMHNRILES